MRQLPENHASKSCWVGVSLRVCHHNLHPGRLTWNLRIRAPWNRKIIFQTIIFRFYVNLPGCTQTNVLIYNSLSLKIPRLWRDLFEILVNKKMHSERCWMLSERWGINAKQDIPIKGLSIRRKKSMHHLGCIKGLQTVGLINCRHYLVTLSDTWVHINSIS